MGRGFTAVLGVMLVLGGCLPEPAPKLEPVGVARLALERAACEAKSGRYLTLASAGLSFCQRLTRDAGKVCTSSGDCEGACLARSRSCAPATPLIGCNEVLTRSGLAVTACVE